LVACSGESGFIKSLDVRNLCLEKSDGCLFGGESVSKVLEQCSEDLMVA
jgi:hypothetical protein